MALVVVMGLASQANFPRASENSEDHTNLEYRTIVTHLQLNWLNCAAAESQGWHATEFDRNYRERETNTYTNTERVCVCVFAESHFDLWCALILRTASHVKVVRHHTIWYEPSPLCRVSLKWRAHCKRRKWRAH